MSTEREESRVDFDQLRACLTTLRRDYPEFLQRAVLIGGGACWFYRALLQSANDPEFRVPSYSVAEEECWLSKDLDFMGLMTHEAEELMPRQVVREENGRCHLQIEGVRLGFAQMCFWLDGETARENCRHAQVQGTDGEPVSFYVADPGSLYREKQYAQERRNAPGDPVHFALLREFVAWDVCNRAQTYLNDPNLENERQCELFLRRVRSLAPEILADERLRRRMSELCAKHRGDSPTRRHAVARLEALI